MADRPIRVLHVASTSLMGGAEQMILAFIRRCDRRRVENHLLTLLGPGLLTDRARAEGVPATNWALPHMLDPRLPLRMRRFLREGNYDLVHCYGLRADLTARWAAGQLNRPCISEVASIDPWRRWHHVRLDRWSARWATAWIAVCEAARDSRIRRERFPADRIHVVYNGIPDAPPPTMETAMDARQQLGLRAGQPVLGVVGNLRKAKGYPDLIDAIATLREQFPELVCLCAGRDDSSGAIARLAEENHVDGAMRWLGFVDDPSPVYAAADIVVSASHWEGCPINLLEAMRAGRPIVATRVGGVPELITEGQEGLLVEPAQPTKLAQAVSSLLGDPERCETMGQAARQAYESRFRVELMAEKTTSLYEQYAGNLA